MGNIFYVYEHYRPDTGMCFYVGKGKDRRAWNFKRSRNPHYTHIIEKLKSNGLKPDVRLVDQFMGENDALNLEISRIAHWRGNGVGIVNYTDGGEGVSGFRHTEKTKQVLREKRANQTIIISEETKRKIGDANRGVKRGEKSDAHKASQKAGIAAMTPEAKAGRSKRAGASLKVAYAEGRMTGSKGNPAWNKGVAWTPEMRKKLSDAHLGYKASDETKLKMSKARTGKKRGAMSAEQKAKISATKLARARKI
jgi:hypothetical protein